MPPMSYLHDLLRWTITKTVRLIGDRVHLQLAPTPSTGNGWPAAGTVQDPFFRESGSKGHQVRPVTVWTETNQIPSETLRTFHTMPDARHKDAPWRRGVHRLLFLTASIGTRACPSHLYRGSTQ